MRVKLVEGYLPEEFRVGFKCPGCLSHHVIPTRGNKAWEFNGNFDSPTFKPSIFSWTEEVKAEDAAEGIHIPATRCHSHVTDGHIQFLSDCTHALKGQTVLLPEIDLQEIPHEEAALKYADKSYDRRTTAYANCFLDFRAGVDWALKYQAAITREETIREVYKLLKSDEADDHCCNNTHGTCTYVSSAEWADWLEKKLWEGK